jgi:hypothetical protein
MSRALTARVQKLERKAGVSDLARLTDDELEARIRTDSAALFAASHTSSDPEDRRLDDRLRQLVASLAADGVDVTGYYLAQESTSLADTEVCS